MKMGEHEMGMKCTVGTGSTVSNVTTKCTKAVDMCVREFRIDLRFNH